MTGRTRASDDALVSEAIAGTALCADCIAKKTGVSPDRVQTIMGTLAGTFRVRRGMAVCDACLTVQAVFQLA